MKSLLKITTALVMLISLHVHAQNKVFDPSAIVAPYRLQITDQKTTVIMFPFAITSVDRGSRFVLAEKVKDAANVLKLKAERQGIAESNLSVITGDGKLYSFIVDVTPDIPYQAIDLRKQVQQEKAAVQFAGSGLNEAQTSACATKVSKQKPFLKIRDKTAKMKLQLAGIYLCRNMIFYQFKVRNKSHLDYTIDFTRFYVRDNKKVKRMAIQEKEITPVLQTAGSATVIPGKSERILVFAFRQFTIADNKTLAIEMYEHGGDRQLNIGLRGKEILKAKPIAP